MNSLRLQWQTGPESKPRNEGKPRLQVLINDQPLTDLVSDFEVTQGYSHFGDEFLLPEDVQWYSLDSWQQSSEPGKRRIVLLGCSCGDVDCSTFYADTFCQDGWIHWQFGGWPERDYSAFPTFWFEQEAYKQQVEIIPDYLNNIRP
ncbi:hypothetical protein [Pseudomaricurvus sp. HS19]|uniref:hypothetical protein n=1 Tax=Pseudomaricurvus sp. HS19 TaxID=2692626 RepID=UPI00136E5EDD|nr:hypothetical protein [Pseudomaricurvus sp. HS19]MYM62673.1 hypothetical protein [Pseudomaricurvus sp. HS19]